MPMAAENYSMGWEDSKLEIGGRRERVNENWKYEISSSVKYRVLSLQNNVVKRDPEETPKNKTPICYHIRNYCTSIRPSAARYADLWPQLSTNHSYCRGIWFCWPWCRCCCCCCCIAANTANAGSNPGGGDGGKPSPGRPGNPGRGRAPPKSIPGGKGGMLPIG